MSGVGERDGPGKPVIPILFELGGTDGEVDPALFVYTPPSDIPVVDMDKVYADRDHK